MKPYRFLEKMGGEQMEGYKGENGTKEENYRGGY